MLAEKRQVKIDGGIPHEPALCYNFVAHSLNNFYFEEATIYSISWETNIQNLTESKIERPLVIRVFSSGGWQYLVQRRETIHFEIDNKNMVEVTLHEPIPNVSLRMISDVNSVIYNLKIFAIKTEDKCKEPDSPLYGQRIWNRNDSVVTFKCDDNFNLTSNLPLNCVDGKWIGSQPKCKLL